MKKEKCPKCGQEYDPAEDQVVVCPTCDQEGSTACCNGAGRGAMCNACEEGEGE